MYNSLFLSNAADALSNEIDFLAFLGMPTGTVLRYVRTTKSLTTEALAEVLEIPLEQALEMEHFREPLQDYWLAKLRRFYL